MSAMREVWNRAQGALTQEPEVGAGAMHFVYGTAFGRLLARGIRAETLSEACKLIEDYE